ncbi:hypothetical protein NPIL_239961 [Nephila pilipes]|uniref:Uncharacterized protein n=1 Tax=Nephila pilipes TaxID=299642 RepID=A0A8X6TMQ9_NEPPI|nr:hypothetical protein NPIL_239961 [Nephila pilipes]
MVLYGGCSAFPKLPKKKNTFTVKTNKIRENHTYAAAVADNPQQRAPRDFDIPTQTEAGRNRGYRYNTDNRPRPAENNHSDNLPGHLTHCKPS